ncbi:MAG: hypothetical protein IJQ33_06150 [Clostridia bacterium]|nr:hypothetical protein [Clostridia bacterium]
MAKMMNPELEVVRFENEDVIAKSGYYIDDNGVLRYFDGVNSNVATGTNTKFDYQDKTGRSAEQTVNENGPQTWFYYNPSTGNYSRDN